MTTENPPMNQTAEATTTDNPPADTESVATLIVGTDPPQTPIQIDPFIEKCVKFTFRAADDDEASEVAMGHFQILKAINDAFGEEVRIFNNQGERITKFKLPSYVAYMRHFTIKHRQPNKRRNRKATYQMFHRLETSVSLSSIRKQEQVGNLLRTYNGSINYHPWTEDVNDTVSLGFFIKVDPTNFRSEDYEAEVTQEIIAATAKRGGIPKFKVVMSSPSNYLPDKSRLRTKAYDLHVQRKDAKAMIDILQQTYMATPKFIFYRMRYSNDKAFNNALKAQNIFLNQTMVVPLIGIPSDFMFYIEDKINAIPGVERVLRHRLTETQGRYNVMTSSPHFRAVTAALNQDLNGMLNDCMDDIRDITHSDTFPEPGVMLPAHDQDSDTGSISSYFSNCSDAYSLYDDASIADGNNPPQESKSSVQAWGKPLSKNIHVSDVTTNTFSAVSDLSSPMELELRALRDANQALTASNELVKNELYLIRQQFSLMQASIPVAPPPRPTSPRPAQPPEVTPQLESALEAIVLRLFEKVQGHPLHPPPHPATPERNPKRTDSKSTPQRTLDTQMQEHGPREEQADDDNEL